MRDIVTYKLVVKRDGLSVGGKIMECISWDGTPQAHLPLFPLEQFENKLFMLTLLGSGRVVD